ncbi:MAG: isochorismatase family protein [Parcubacteria group bacterium]|nr:isochorismatase family protein [Parcubacteria group bacterium]
MKFNQEEIASFDVDAQKGFTPLCPNELPVPNGDQIVEELNKQATYAPIRIGSKDAHPMVAIWTAFSSLHPQLQPVEGRSVDVRWNRHCVVGSKGFCLLDGLPHPLDYDYFAWKGMEPDVHPYGACYHDLQETRTTGIIEFLISKKIKCVIVGGLATEYCVKTTAIQLAKAGFTVIVNLEACKGFSNDTIDKAVEEMLNYKIEIISSTKEIENYIK